MNKGEIRIGTDKKRFNLIIRIIGNWTKTKGRATTSSGIVIQYYDHNK